MKYCSTCGKQLYDNAVICPCCGVQVKAVDKPSKGFAAIGFLCPIIGLILYIVEHNNYPKKASSALKGALCGIIFLFALPVLSVILSLAMKL